MSPLANGGLGGQGANRANRANPPPRDPAPAPQVTYGVGWGLTGLTGGGGGARRYVNLVQHRDPVIGHGWPS